MNRYRSPIGDGSQWKQTNGPVPDHYLGPTHPGVEPETGLPASIAIPWESLDVLGRLFGTPDLGKVGRPRTSKESQGQGWRKPTLTRVQGLVFFRP